MDSKSPTRTLPNHGVHLVTVDILVTLARLILILLIDFLLLRVGQTAARLENDLVIEVNEPIGRRELATMCNFVAIEQEDGTNLANVRAMLITNREIRGVVKSVAWSWS